MEELHQTIIDNEIATEKEISLVSNINGYSIKTLENILYARTGYNSLEQYNS